MNAKMSTTIFVHFLALLMVAGIAASICCDEIKGLVESKLNAYETLCSTGNNLPAKCCSGIASEVRKLRDSYEDLCQSTGRCDVPKALGMESGTITDAQITASSTYSSSYLPKYGRLNKHLGSCAWTSTAAGRAGSWHKVDFGKITYVTGVATQGNCVNSERVKSYLISYSTDNANWKTYRESSIDKIFTGNEDKTTVSTHSFKNPILARYVRLLPQTWNSYPGLRVEYYGCSSEI